MLRRLAKQMKVNFFEQFHVFLNNVLQLIELSFITAHVVQVHIL